MAWFGRPALKKLIIRYCDVGGSSAGVRCVIRGGREEKEEKETKRKAEIAAQRHVVCRCILAAAPRCAARRSPH